MKKPVKQRIKDKISATKDKVKAKVKHVAILALLSVLVGCASSEPASRVTKAEYGDIVIKIAESSNTTVKLTLGDGAMSSSDSSGSTETTTSSPTNTTDLRPDVDVNTTGSRTAGVLETAISAGISALTSSSSTNSSSTSSSTTTSTDGTCTDGSCSTCTDGSCTP